MPVILSNDQERVWLDNGMADVSELLSILKPYPAEEMNYKSGIGPHNGNCQE
jgi:putative SOS response-associated peptidase YedK